MSKNALKFNGCGTHRRAILHMIGQSVDVLKSKPKTSEIAVWMQVSKPTARKYLKKMEQRGELIRTEKHWRGSAVTHLWELHPIVEEHYHEGRLKDAYQLYASRVLKVIAL